MSWIALKWERKQGKPTLYCGNEVSLLYAVVQELGDSFYISIPVKRSHNMLS